MTKWFFMQNFKKKGSKDLVGKVVERSNLITF